MLWLVLAAVNFAAAAAAIYTILRRQTEPAAMLAWIFAVMLLPFLGSTLYAVAGSTRIHRRARRRRKRIAQLASLIKRTARSRTDNEPSAARAKLPDDLALIEGLARRLIDAPATSGNQVRVFEEANATYYALEEAIHEARDSIHLEYYIWQPDQTGQHFARLLIDKARGGVECRLLLDAVGSWRLGRAAIRPMLDAGVRIAWFLPVNPLRKRWGLNLRNHRKNVVLDGRVAFVGSQNIGDEYLGRLKGLSPFRDAHMRLSGPAVLFVQQTFAEDWSFATGDGLADPRYFPTPERPGDSIVQMLDTGPDQDVSVLEQIVFAAVSTARKSIRVATPYFVPGPGLRMGLNHAAYRGVNVQIVLPTRHDHPAALWAGRSFYGELLSAGVGIFEYDGGMLHSKIITVDDRWCMVGSANMDVRSFRLNFESTALIYDPRVALDLSLGIDRDVRRSRQVTMQDVHQRRIGVQLLCGAARILSPLL